MSEQRTGKPGSRLRANPAPRCAERSMLFCEIPLDLKQEVVAACAAEGVTLVSIVCEVLEDWLLSREGVAA
jgi:tryptophan synthase alpha subunit